MDTGIHFLQRKIGALRSAIFYNYSDAELRLKPSVVEIEKVDENGEISFHVNKPFIDTSGLDKVFAARLYCYKKNAGYVVQVHGKATLTSQENDQLLVTIKILSAELIKLAPISSTSIKGRFVYWLDKLFYHREGYYYNLN